MTQKKTILKYLKSGNAITSLGAFHIFGITRLASVVNKLREHDNEPVHSTWISVVNRDKKVVRVKRYYMATKKRGRC